MEAKITKWKSFSITDEEIALLPALRKELKCANDSHLLRVLIHDAKRRMDKRKKVKEAAKERARKGMTE